MLRRVQGQFRAFSTNLRVTIADLSHAGWETASEVAKIVGGNIHDFFKTHQKHWNEV